MHIYICIILCYYIEFLRVGVYLKYDTPNTQQLSDELEAHTKISFTTHT